MDSPIFPCGCGSKSNRRAKPQALVHVSTYQGKPFWNSGVLSHSHVLGERVIWTKARILWSQLAPLPFSSQHVGLLERPSHAMARGSDWRDGSFDGESRIPWYKAAIPIPWQSVSDLFVSAGRDLFRLA